MYDVSVDGQSVETDLVEALWEDECPYFRYRLTSRVPVKQGQTVDISVWITSNLQTMDPVQCFRSDNGLETMKAGSEKCIPF